MSKSAVAELEKEVRRIEEKNPIPVFDEDNKIAKRKISFETLKKLADSIKDEVIDYV